MNTTSMTVDSYRFLDGVTKRVMRYWAGLPGEARIPWTPMAKPLARCTVALVSSAAIALKTDPAFDAEIERRDPWFADPSYRVVPQATRTGDVQVCHLHINPAFALQDLNTVLRWNGWANWRRAARSARRRRPTTRTWAIRSVRSGFSGRACRRWCGSCATNESMWCCWYRFDRSATGPWDWCNARSKLRGSALSRCR